MTEDLWKRKKDLCEEILETLKVDKIFIELIFIQI